MKTLSTISATTIGGRDGNGQTSDGKLKVEFALPKELGGRGKPDGVTPEHLFAQGYAACFGSALQYAAGQKKIHLSHDFSVTVTVDLLQTDAGGFALGAKLKANLPGVEKAQAEELVKIAHTICPYSNAIKGNVNVELSVA
jgi:osmotically inducible protein OsmC